uniref:Peroxiredoxin like 2C n=1 Tax=Macaca mulatta TaxID=9544 RepID=A0A5F8AE09_MACMU
GGARRGRGPLPTRRASGQPVPAPRAPPLVASRTAKYRALSGRAGAAFLTCPFCPIGFQHFLCYICKEYVEDLAKIPKSFLQEANVTLIVIGQSSYHHIEPFCRLTGYSHEIYVDPEREIYKRLGMKRGEEIASSGQSPHVKSNLLSGSLQSLWRAVTGPLFDFQGDPAQQGGILILGPGKRSKPRVSSGRLVPFTSSEAAIFFSFFFFFFFLRRSLALSPG